MRILVKTGVILLGLAALLVGISFNVLRAQDLGPRDTGSRTLATETRQVKSDVVIVKLEGSIDLILKQGAVPAMTVKAEQRLLSNIVTAQEGNTLRISTKGLIINSRKPMVIELTLPALQQLQVVGSGDSQVSGFSGDAMVVALQGSGDVDFSGKYKNLTGTLGGSGDLRLHGGDMEAVELNLRGSGDVSAEGRTKTLAAKLMGSGDLHSRKLLADAVTVDVMGSGDANVFAKSSAKINVMGSGDVNVAGSPVTRNISRHGAGDVNFE
jgi:hypothetical protein